MQNGEALKKSINELDIEELISAKQEARAQFGGTTGVTGFGLGDGTVRIYILNTAVGEMLPRKIANIPIELVVTGEIEAH